MDRSAALNIVVGIANRTKAGFAKVDSDLKKLSTKAESASKRLHKLGNTLRGASLIAGAALGGAAAAAIKYESKLADLGTIIGKNEKALKKFKSGLIDIGKEFGKSPAKLAAQHYNILSAGITDTEESLETMRESVRLSIAGVGTLEESVDLMTSALNAFSEQGVEATDVAQIMNDAVRNGKTTVAELSQGFGSAAPLIAAAGVSIEEFMASVSAMTTGGQKANEAYVYLRAGLTGLMKPTEDLQKVFTALGVTTHTELIASQGGLIKAFEAVKTKGGEMGFQLADMFGNVRAMTALTAIGTESFRDTFVTAYGQMTDSVDQMSDEVALKMESTEVALDKAKVAVEALAIKAGDVLKPIIQAATKAVTKFTEWIGNSSEGTMRFGLTLLGVIAAAAPTIKIVAGMIGALKALRLTTIAGGVSFLAFILALTWVMSNFEKAQLIGKAFTDSLAFGVTAMAAAVLAALELLSKGIFNTINFLKDTVAWIAKGGAAVGSLLGIDTSGLKEWSESAFKNVKNPAQELRKQADADLARIADDPNTMTLDKLGREWQKIDDKERKNKAEADARLQAAEATAKAAEAESAVVESEMAAIEAEAQAAEAEGEKVKKTEAQKEAERILKERQKRELAQQRLLQSGDYTDRLAVAQHELQYADSYGFGHQEKLALIAEIEELKRQKEAREKAEAAAEKAEKQREKMIEELRNLVDTRNRRGLDADEREALDIDDENSRFRILIQELNIVGGPAAAEDFLESLNDEYEDVSQGLPGTA